MTSNQTPPSYRHKKKFAKFIKACELDTPTMIVSDLFVLWDTIEEIVCNIGIAKEHNKQIVIVESWVIIKPE
jgi:hypothetical protein